MARERGSQGSGDQHPHRRLAKRRSIRERVISRHGARPRPRGDVAERRATVTKAASAGPAPGLDGAAHHGGGRGDVVTPGRGHSERLPGGSPTDTEGTDSEGTGNVQLDKTP